ncbi:hypothetical protein KV697_13560 [Sphingomonas sanguinis]|uniref:hypothetical protein n=1 Tax=Sphingomonas sanguinis TaxID=33051 RepID=UPI001C56E3E3|nr:hypothetical protein [Sphingomonas sanguinis]QXT34807.1 hypothetical protein KV697_13560 [Sphingomonas sanguinis]
MRTKPSTDDVPASGAGDQTYRHQPGADPATIPDGSGKTHASGEDGGPLPPAGEMPDHLRRAGKEFVRSTGRASRPHASGNPPKQAAAGSPASAGSHGSSGAADRMDARRSADEALTLAAFVHLGDPDLDALDGYDVYLRALIPIRHRYGGVNLGMATPTAFRRRVDDVRAALSSAAEQDRTATPTIH